MLTDYRYLCGEQAECLTHIDEYVERALGASTPEDINELRQEIGQLILPF